MSEMTKMVLMGIAGIIVFGLLVYGGWHLKRWFNYSWGYESQVTETVCSMVKPEHLIDPKKCD